MGTGAAGAAWAAVCDGRPQIVGLDRHPWALAEELKASMAQVQAGAGAAIDAVGGSFAAQYTTVVVTAARTGGA